MLPEWVSDYANDCRALLGVDDGWHIVLEAADDLDNAAGETIANAAYLNATIRLRPDIRPGSGHAYILHEMMHVALAQIDLVAMEAIKQLPECQAEAYLRALHVATEQSIQRMARALLRQVETICE